MQPTTYGMNLTGKNISQPIPKYCVYCRPFGIAYVYVLSIFSLKFLCPAITLTTYISSKFLQKIEISYYRLLFFKSMELEKHLKEGHTKRVNSMVSVGNTVWSAGDDTALFIWDIEVFSVNFLTHEEINSHQTN